jgi:hypothetical protein
MTGPEETAEPFPTGWGRALGLAFVAAVALAVLRWAQLRSIEPLLYHGEFTGLGRRIVDLYGGGEPPVFRDLQAFWDRYQYQTYAQGTVYTQVAGAWFARWLGPTTRALHATTVVAECATVFVASALAFRTLALRWAWVVVAAFVFLPVLVVGWQLAPYGNHTEFQVFPVLLAAFVATTAAQDRDEGRWIRWLLPAAAIAVGLILYRGNAPPVLAFFGTVLWTRSKGRLARGVATAVGGLLVAYVVLAYVIGAGLTGIGPEAFGAEGVPSIIQEGVRQHSLYDAIATVARESLPAAPRWLGGGMPTRGLLGLGWLIAAMSWLPASGEVTPGRLLSRYASLWALGAVAAVLLGHQAFPRYLIGAYYALLLCWTGVLVGAARVGLRSLAAGALGLIALGGLAEGWYWVVPGVWDATDDLNGIPLWFELNVNYIDLDELPYYQRLLDEGRGSRWIGWSSHHVPLGCLAQGALVAQPNYFPRPSLDACHGFDTETARFIAEEAARELARNPQFDFEASMQDVGIGMWIRSDHDLGLMITGLKDVPERLRRPILAGATAESMRWETP